MKTITIHQPFASAIVKGGTCEAYKSFSTDYRGKVLIHASKVMLNKDLLNLSKEEKEKWDKINDSLPHGAIVGTATLVGCEEVEDKRYRWTLKEGARFDKPVMGVRGRTGVWEYDGELPKEPAKSPQKTQPKGNKGRMSEAIVEAAEHIKKYAADKIYHDLDKGLSQQEKIDLTVYPYVLAEMGIKYASMAQAEGVKYKIGSLRDSKRAIDDLIKRWREESLLVIGYSNRRSINVISSDMLEAQVFTQLYFTVNNIILRLAPSDPYAQMRTYTYVAMVLFRLLAKHMDNITEKLRPRFKFFNINVLSVPDVIYSIAQQLRNYTGSIKNFPFDDINVSNGEKVIYNEIKRLNITLTKK